MGPNKQPIITPNFTMADDLRSSTKVGENPTFATTVSKQEGILGDKAVGGMDNDKDHVENVIGGLKAYVFIPLPLPHPSPAHPNPFPTTAKSPNPTLSPLQIFSIRVPGGEFSFSRLGGRHCNPSFSFSFDAQS